MFMNVDAPTWWICTACGDTEEADIRGNILPDGWYLQRDENSWIVYCPCISEEKKPEKEPTEKDGSGYTAGGTAWNPSTSTTTTWNPGMFSVDMYTYPPLRKPKTPQQEKVDAILAEMEEEKTAQRERWLKWEETKHSKHMDPTCEQCAEEIERIRRELKDYGKGNKEEK
jgi:hypothetical protein